MLTHEMIDMAVRKAAHEFSISKAEYFGSYADGCATEESDLDLLVEFNEATARISLLTIIRLKHYLENELSKPVDVVQIPLASGAIIEIGKTVSIL